MRTIGFIGAGKTGTSLGNYLIHCGLEVTGYFSKRAESAREAAAITETKVYDSLQELAAASGMIFLTVPDSEIEAVWNQLKHYPVESKIICHCSGALSSAVFTDIDQCGAFGYSIHPLLAISSRTISYQQMQEACFTVEGASVYRDEIAGLLRSAGNQVFTITPEQKPGYHAGAVFASNFVHALVQVGISLLAGCGFDQASAEQALMPLMLHNCRKIAEDGITETLTGPVERGDAATIERHLEALDGSSRQLYQLLSGVLAELAAKKHPDRDYEAVRQAITEGMQ